MAWLATPFVNEHTNPQAYVTKTTTQVINYDMQQYLETYEAVPLDEYTYELFVHPNGQPHNFTVITLKTAAANDFDATEQVSCSIRQMFPDDHHVTVQLTSKTHYERLS